MRWLIDYVVFLFEVLQPPDKIEDMDLGDWLVYLFFFLPLSISVHWFIPVLLVFTVTAILKGE
ncbi:hypothetical protein D3C84_1257830 [compost metagenome]